MAIHGRRVGAWLLAVGAAACAGDPPDTAAGGDADVAVRADPVVHVHAAGAEGIFANAYVIETENAVVVVDALLTVPDAEALRARVEAIDKPLHAVLLTHGHPDHYNGVAILVGDRDVPVYATAGVANVIERDDVAKEAQWRPMFGDAWPSDRRFPDHVVEDGATVEVDGARFVVHDIGPAESDHDSYWVLEGPTRAAFVGDLAFNDVHAYLADGNTGPWLAALDRLDAELVGVDVLYPGHGAPGDLGLIAGQRAYIVHFRDRIAELAQGRPTLSDEEVAQIVEEMRAYLPTDRLEFLIEMGAVAVAAELAGEPGR